MPVSSGGRCREGCGHHAASCRQTYALLLQMWSFKRHVQLLVVLKTADKQLKFPQAAREACM